MNLHARVKYSGSCFRFVNFCGILRNPLGSHIHEMVINSVSYRLVRLEDGHMKGFYNNIIWYFYPTYGTY